MSYNVLNDYELVYQVKENNEIAYNTIFDKYTPLVKKIAYDYYKCLKHIGISLDDLCQEGFVAVSKALCEYDGKTSLFYTYVYVCIRREMDRYIKSYKRQKNKHLNEAISLSAPIIAGEDDICLEDVIPSKFSVEDYFEFEELFKKVYYHKYDFDFEFSLVYELKINKFSNVEISKLLEISYRDVEKMVKVIKNNVKIFMREDTC